MRVDSDWGKQRNIRDVLYVSHMEQHKDIANILDLFIVVVDVKLIVINIKHEFLKTYLLHSF